MRGRYIRDLAARHGIGQRIETASGRVAVLLFAPADVAKLAAFRGTKPGRRWPESQTQAAQGLTPDTDQPGNPAKKRRKKSDSASDAPKYQLSRKRRKPAKTRQKP